MQVKGKVLSIDYGLKRIGFAVSDEYRIIAKPLKTLDNTNNIIQETISIIEELKINLIIVGIPIRDDDKNDKFIQLIKKFAFEISEKTNINVIFVDEFMSSRKAVEIMVRNNKKKSQRRKKSEIDKISAAVFLQEFLENN